jgi:hypothetical protein
MVWLLMMCGNQYSQSPVIFAPLDFIALLTGAGNKARGSRKLFPEGSSV